MPQTITFRGTRRQLVELLKKLPKVLAGKVYDQGGATAGVLKAMGLELLGKVQDAFEKKSTGGTDDLGVKWEPLAPATLALRRKNSGGSVVERLKRDFNKMGRDQRRLVATHYHRLLSLYRASAAKSTASASARRSARRILEFMRPTIAPGRYAKLSGQLKGDLPKDRAKREAMAG
ncbi:MAG TPA: hypothetical protein PJ982_13120, partial [Lacipirellulaceae bacterium]|nr:hypothetical protein [Lacipirellulaceae bacterium]